MRLCVSLVLLGICSGQPLVRTSERHVDLTSFSGKMRLYPSEDSKSFIEVAQDFLLESTPSGEQVQMVDLGRASVVWQTPSVLQDETTSDYEAVSFTHLLNEHTTFAFAAKLFKADGGLPYGPAKLQVLKNELEFSINVTSWPFRAPENTLTYGITVDSRGGGKSKRGKLPTLDDAKRRRGKDPSAYSKPQKEALFDTGNLLAPTTALVDGVERDITIQINEKPGPKGKSGKTLITFQFPSFQQNLYYDPILSAFPGLSWEHIALMSFGVCLLAVCFFKFFNRTGVQKKPQEVNQAAPAAEGLRVKHSVQTGRSYHAVTVLTPADAPAEY